MTKLSGLIGFGAGSGGTDSRATFIHRFNKTGFILD